MVWQIIDSWGNRGVGGIRPLAIPPRAPLSFKSRSQTASLSAGRTIVLSSLLRDNFSIALEAIGCSRAEPKFHLWALSFRRTCLTLYRPV